MGLLLCTSKNGGRLADLATQKNNIFGKFCFFVKLTLCKNKNKANLASCFKTSKKKRFKIQSKVSNIAVSIKHPE